MHSRSKLHRPKHGLARVLSKLGYCSRAQAKDLIRAGQVELNGRVCRDPQTPVDQNRDRIHVQGRGAPVAEQKVYLMLNKPRGLVTTRSDEQGRLTVYECLRDHKLPWVFPVGRLDQASEGMLLFTNDTAWGDRLQSPEHHVPKTYHVQVDTLVNDDLCEKLMSGARTSEGDWLMAKSVHVLRRGSRNTWLEIVLEEGKNRHIRRLLATERLNVLRLIRIAIGTLQLGSLVKGQVRHLTSAELDRIDSAVHRGSSEGR